MATPVYLDDGGMPSRRPLVRSLASNLATIALPTFYSGFNGRLGELTTAKSYPESPPCRLPAPGEGRAASQETAILRLPKARRLGYLFGNQTGNATATRAYWSNKSFTARVTQDVPHEARLEPAQWGSATVE